MNQATAVDNSSTYLNIDSLQEFDSKLFSSYYWNAFKGLASLYGINNLAKNACVQVIVLGIGGVGSWVAEGLARNGIGSIVVVDADDVSVSNINRQLVALNSTVGDEKTQIIKERIYDINQLTDIKIIDQYLTIDNMESIICPHPFTNGIFYEEKTASSHIIKIFTNKFQNKVFVIDCIDDARVKTHLVNYCRRNKIKLVVCGAAGGKIDPSKIAIDDMTQVIQDPLIANIRNSLRRNYGYKERFKDKKFSVPVVYSSEQIKLPSHLQTCDLQGLNCNNGYGSSMVVTATFANFAVAKMIEIIHNF